MKVAVFVDKDGNVLPFYATGTVGLYAYEGHKWACVKQIPFEIHDGMSMVEVRSRIVAMVHEMEGCKLFVVDTIKGFPLTILKDQGMGIWNFKGVLAATELLNHIKEEVDKVTVAKHPVTILPVAIGNAKDGNYRINLVEIMDSDSSLNSKQVLLPFFQNTVFKELEIICKHVPKWFEKAFGTLQLQVRVNESTDGLCHAIVSPDIVTGNRPYVAVATDEGMLVNAHLGDADSLYIYKQTANGFQYVEERATPESGCGNLRWQNMATLLNDCRALLASGVGPNPLKILQGSGIRVIQMTGLIDDGLEAVYNGKIINAVKDPDTFKCGEGGCGGNARGCA